MLTIRSTQWWYGGCTKRHWTGGVLGAPCGFEALLGVPMLIACDPDCRADEIEIANATPDPDDNPHRAAIAIVPSAGWQCTSATDVGCSNCHQPSAPSTQDGPRLLPIWHVACRSCEPVSRSSPGLSSAAARPPVDLQVLASLGNSIAFPSETPPTPGRY